MADEPIEEELSEEEMAQMAQEAGQAIKGAAKKVKESLDKDGDGSISFDEAVKGGADGFIKADRAMGTVTSAVVTAGADRIIETKNAAVDTAKEVGDAFDLDGDGKVSAEEVGAIAKQAAVAAGKSASKLMGKAKGLFGGFLSKLDD